MDATADQKATPRTLSRDARRHQLIEATIQTLARRGSARTTLTEVAREAGLSHGLVNFHFQTKEKLMAETLAYLAEEYRLNWSQALEAAGEDPADQLIALIEADFSPRVCTPNRLAAWCSFWGEAQSRPFYQERNGANDRIYNDTMEFICGRLIADIGAPLDAARVARIIRSTVEGIWLDLMTLSSPYDVAEGLATAKACVALCFPARFGPHGLR